MRSPSHMYTQVFPAPNTDSESAATEGTVTAASSSRAEATNMDDHPPLLAPVLSVHSSCPVASPIAVPLQNVLSPRPSTPQGQPQTQDSSGRQRCTLPLDVIRSICERMEKVLERQEEAFRRVDSRVQRRAMEYVPLNLKSQLPNLQGMEELREWGDESPVFWALPLVTSVNASNQRPARSEQPPLDWTHTSAVSCDASAPQLQSLTLLRPVVAPVSYDEMTYEEERETLHQAQQQQEQAEEQQTSCPLVSRWSAAGSAPHRPPRLGFDTQNTSSPRDELGHVVVLQPLLVHPTTDALSASCVSLSPEASSPVGQVLFAPQRMTEDSTESLSVSPLSRPLSSWRESPYSAQVMRRDMGGVNSTLQPLYLSTLGYASLTGMRASSSSPTAGSGIGMTGSLAASCNMTPMFDTSFNRTPRDRSKTSLCVADGGLSWPLNPSSQSTIFSQQLTQHSPRSRLDSGGSDGSLHMKSLPYQQPRQLFAATSSHTEARVGVTRDDSFSPITFSSCNTPKDVKVASPRGPDPPVRIMRRPPTVPQRNVVSQLSLTALNDLCDRYSSERVDISGREFLEEPLDEESEEEVLDLLGNPRIARNDNNQRDNSKSDTKHRNAQNEEQEEIEEGQTRQANDKYHFRNGRISDEMEEEEEEAEESDWMSQPQRRQRLFAPSPSRWRTSRRGRTSRAKRGVMNSWDLSSRLEELEAIRMTNHEALEERELMSVTLSESALPHADGPSTSTPPPSSCEVTVVGDYYASRTTPPPLTSNRMNEMAPSLLSPPPSAPTRPMLLSEYAKMQPLPKSASFSHSTSSSSSSSSSSLAGKTQRGTTFFVTQETEQKDEVMAPEGDTVIETKTRAFPESSAVGSKDNVLQEEEENFLVFVSSAPEKEDKPTVTMKKRKRRMMMSATVSPSTLDGSASTETKELHLMKHVKGQLCSSSNTEMNESDKTNYTKGTAAEPESETVFFKPIRLKTPLSTPRVHLRHTPRTTALPCPTSAKSLLQRLSLLRGPLRESITALTNTGIDNMEDGKSKGKRRASLTDGKENSFSQRRRRTVQKSGKQSGHMRAVHQHSPNNNNNGISNPGSNQSYFTTNNHSNNNTSTMSHPISGATGALHAGGLTQTLDTSVVLISHNTSPRRRHADGPTRSTLAGTPTQTPSQTKTPAQHVTTVHGVSSTTSAMTPSMVAGGTTNTTLGNPNTMNGVPLSAPTLVSAVAGSGGANFSPLNSPERRAARLRPARERHLGNESHNNPSRSPRLASPQRFHSPSHSQPTYLLPTESFNRYASWQGHLHSTTATVGSYFVSSRGVRGTVSSCAATPTTPIANSPLNHTAGVSMSVKHLSSTPVMDPRRFVDGAETIPSDTTPKKASHARPKRARTPHARTRHPISPLQNTFTDSPPLTGETRTTKTSSTHVSPGRATLRGRKGHGTPFHTSSSEISNAYTQTYEERNTNGTRAKQRSPAGTHPDVWRTRIGAKATGLSPETSARTRRKPNVHINKGGGPPAIVRRYSYSGATGGFYNFHHVNPSLTSAGTSARNTAENTVSYGNNVRRRRSLEYNGNTPQAMLSPRRERVRWAPQQSRFGRLKSAPSYF